VSKSGRGLSGKEHNPKGRTATGMFVLTAPGGKEIRKRLKTYSKCVQKVRNGVAPTHVKKNTAYTRIARGWGGGGGEMKDQKIKDGRNKTQ